MATLAMLVREPGQSLFVARAPETTRLWVNWPSEYGLPGSAEPLQRVVKGNPNIVGHHWSLHRRFKNGEITADHLGVSISPGLQTFDVSQLAPDLRLTAYTLRQPPTWGAWDATTNTYTAYGAGVDHFILGAQCTGNFCSKLITISVRVFN